MRTLIIEDEADAIERLESLLKEVAPEMKIAGKCKGVKQCLQWLNENDYPDLIISDIKLSDGLSFEIIRQMDKPVPVIFTSNHDIYAVDAFKAHGLHYLLKPIKKEELKEAIKRYEASFPKQNQSQTGNIGHAINAAKEFQERFIINIGNQIRLVHDYEIAYIFTLKKLVYIMTFTRQKIIVDISLQDFEKLLNPKLFFRINRKFIVNMVSIKKMKPASKQRIELTLEPDSLYEAITSFERTPQFKKWLLGENSIKV